MGRYQKTSSQALYSPTVLRLRSAAHRATLDRNEVAVLSGRDPKEIGSIGRMPGGKKINNGSPADASIAHQARFFQRRGVAGGHVLRTVTIANFTVSGTGAKTLYVRSTAGFEVGDWLACWSSANAVIGKITAINVDATGPYFTFSQSAGGGSTTQIASGARVARCLPTGSTNISTDSSSHNVLWPMDLEVGMKVLLVGNRNGSDSTAEVQIASISGNTVNWSPTSGPTKSGPPAIVPVFANYASSVAYVSMGDGAGIGDLYGFAGGAFKLIWDASAEGFSSLPWDTALYDRNILAVNGRDRPRRIHVHADLMNPSAPSQRPSVGYVGWPDPPAFGTIHDTSGAAITNGTHRYLVRLVDKSVVPYAKSPAVWQLLFTYTGAGGTPRLNISTLLGTSGLLRAGIISEGFRRATHLQVLMTPAGLTQYFLAKEVHLSNLVPDGGSAWTTTYDMGLTDDALLLRASVENEDIDKGRMPLGRHVHHYSGITLVGGVTDADAEGEHPRILSGNMVHYSRTDRTEPENFPAENFESVGSIGDDVRGFVQAADVTLILCRWSFTTFRRAGTFVFLDDAGGLNMGLAHEGAYCSMGTHAAWVADESIWLFDGMSQEEPEDIGADIADWVRDLKNAKRVRVGYDPVNAILWVGRMGDDPLGAADDRSAECMLFDFRERVWIKRENVVLDAPFSGYSVEVLGAYRPAFYRMCGAAPHVYRAVDYDDEPLVDGGFNPATNTLSGTLASPLSNATTLSGLTLPAGATNALRGQVIHFIRPDTTEYIRVLSGSNTTSVTWTTLINLEAGTKWIIGGIPFRLRWPPIRGQDPFATKVIHGAQVMLDGINYGSQAGQTALLNMHLMRDFQNYPEEGGMATLPLISGVAVTGADRACAAQAAGNVLEVEIQQLDRHVDFSLIYEGLPVTIPGVYGGDRNVNV